MIQASSFYDINIKVDVHLRNFNPIKISASYDFA